MIGDKTRAFEMRRLRINAWDLAKTKTGLCLNYIQIFASHLTENLVCDIGTHHYFVPPVWWPGIRIALTYPLRVVRGD